MSGVNFVGKESSQRQVLRLNMPRTGGEEKLCVHQGLFSAVLLGAYATSASTKGNSLMQWRNRTGE